MPFTPLMVKAKSSQVRVISFVNSSDFNSILLFSAVFLSAIHWNETVFATISRYDNEENIAYGEELENSFAAATHPCCHHDGYAGRQPGTAKWNRH